MILALCATKAPGGATREHLREAAASLSTLIRGAIVYGLRYTQKPTWYRFRFFYEQYLVQFIMVPRNCKVLAVIIILHCSCWVKVADWRFYSHAILDIHELR